MAKAKRRGTTVPILDDLRAIRAADPEFDARVEIELTAVRVEDGLAKLRGKRGLSQRELAKRANVKQPMIARLEAGRSRNLELRTLIRLATAMDATVEVKIKPRRRRSRRTATA